MIHRHIKACEESITCFIESLLEVIFVTMVPRVSNLGLGAQDVIHPKLITTHMIGDGEQQEDIGDSEGYKVAGK